MTRYEDTLWTSKLTIYADCSYTEIDNLVKSLSKHLENYLSSFKEDSEINKLERPVKFSEFYTKVYQPLTNYSFVLQVSPERMYKFGSYKGDGSLDLTGLVKGLFIDILEAKIKKLSKYYIINFGGDGVINCDADIMINDGFTTHVISPMVRTAFFTSANGSKRRGKHIKGAPYEKQVTLIQQGSGYTCAELDMLATTICAGENCLNTVNLKIFKYNKVSNIENNITGVDNDLYS